MSVATGNKGEKAKKFQSLNINNIYQGSALKPLQKNIPQKHGLQSLGKVPTARRAPANLPSLKAEHSGNDPTINLVPAGHSASGGWTANSLKDEHGEAPKSVKNEASNSLVAPPQPGKVLSSSSSGGGHSVPPVNNNLHQQQTQPPLAPQHQQPPSSVSSKATWGSGSGTAPNNKGSGPFLSQKSPLFGQEFPSLTGQPEVSASRNASESTSPSPPPGSKADSKYGPGPSLRPQSFATWSFSGKQSSQSPSNSIEKEMPDKSSTYDTRNNRNHSAEAGSTNSLKFDVGVNSPLLAQGAPYLGRKSTPQRSQLVNKTSQPSQNSRPRDNLFQGSIIDSEKLKRMDDIDSNDDDWTRRDDSFDYNKRIDSDDDDDEDDLSLNERSDSNWTEQINFSSSARHSEPRDNFKPSNNSSSFARGGRGGHRNESSSGGGGKVVPMDSSHDHNHLSFLDDEDQRLSKKNEEVLKNIERARRRRAEEEQKYRVADDLNHYNDTFPSNAKRMNDHHRNNAGSHFENGGGLLKSSSANSPFGRFDVGESDGYDSNEKIEGYEATGGGSGTPVSSVNNPSSRKQNHQQQQSVPPRFKRHGVELHTYKRTSPPKERTSGDQGDQHNDVRSSASRDSAESQPPTHESKDFGALFRQSSSSGGSSRGNRPQSGSISDLDARNDHHHHYHQTSAVAAAANAEESIKKIKETDEEIVNFSRGTGGRHSGKNNKGAPRSSADDVSKHKGNSSSKSTVENSKDQKQHKRGGNESKSDRSGQRGSGQRAKDSGGGSAKNNDRKQQHGENSKNGSGSGRRGGAVQRKEDDNEASVHRPSGGSGRQAVIGEETTLGATIENHSFEPSATGTAQEGFAGWFAPRGQPSRRGRGGLSSSGSLNRTSAPNKSAAEGNAESDDVKSVPMEFSRKSQPRDAEWDDTSSDPSEEIRNKDNRRRGGGGGERSGGQSENKSNQRREKPRKQQGKKGSNDPEDKKAIEEDNESATQMNRNRHRGGAGGGGGGNSSRNQRLDDKESRKGNSANERGDRRGGVASERDTKQSSYERRQSKLPPRFAKQKEQNRLSGQSSAQEAWGMSSATDPSGRISDSPHMTSGVAWDHSVPPASQQQFISCVQQTANLSGGGSKPVVDFEANRALLMQRFRNENALANVAADSSNTQLRLDGNINIGGSATASTASAGNSGCGGGPNMEEVFNPAESRDNAVQTIIFENTNFKGKRPINSSATGTAAVGNVPSGGTNVGNEKLMFKLAAGTAGSDHHPKSGLGYGSPHNTATKVEDDIKLDFSFETADMSSHTGEDKGTPNTSSKPNAVRPASSAAAAAAVVAAGVVTAQPATADDLNMKIASVKKVWETLPSMSPPSAPSGDQATIGGPFSSAPSTANDDQTFDAAAAATTRYDKESNSSSNMAKVRPQQQPSQQAHQQAPSQHHLQSPPSQAQGAVPSQSHQSSAQVQQLHSHHQASNQLHHATQQGLLQQASALDDRLIGRSNNANLTYNRLLGTGGLPNLQSPPSILGQQPSLYQAFQIDPNRAVTNQLYPYPPTAGMGGQSLILPPSGSSLSAANTGAAPSAGDIFGSTSSNQFSRQFAGPPPGSNQVSSAMNNVLMSQSSLMSSAMKPSVASAGIGPIGTKGAYQQGGLGSLPGSGTSPLLIPYDGGYVQNIQRSAAAGQTAFYQALAASSQQAAAAAASSSRQNNYGITGFPGQNSLVQQQQQQQLLRNHAPHPMNNHPYMKNDSNALKASTVAQQLASGLQAQRQFSATNAGPGSNGGQSQPPSIKGTATSLASMSLRNSVLGTGATVTNGATVTSATTVQQTVTSYSPTPIQRPPGGKGKATLEPAEDSPTVTLDVAAGVKEKKLSDVED